MKNAPKVMGSLIVALLMFVLWSTSGLSQDQDKRQGPSARPQPQKKLRQIGAEEKLVRDVYARLMRYQSAATDELASREGKSSQPTDYLTFELRDIRSGPIEKISDGSLSELVTPRNGAFLAVTPNHLSNGDGPAHAYYEAKWAQTPAEVQAPESTVGELLRKNAAQGRGANRYTSYEVTIRFEGQSRTYRALALYQFEAPGENRSQTTPELVRPGDVEILDNITSEINSVLKDESPRVQSPWGKYVQTNWYRAVANNIRETQAAKKPLIPGDAPIGYLPGDNVQPSTQELQFVTNSDPCQATTVSITIAGVANADKSTVGGLVVLNSDNNNAPRQQITVEQAQPAASYTGNVTLTRSNTKVRLFTAATGGAELTFNGADNRFANSTLPRSFYVEGAAFSDAMRDVTLVVTSDDGATDQATFTVLWVDQPTVSFSGPLSADNAARQTYINWTTAGVNALGVQTYNANFGERMGWGTEAAAVVHPATFNYPGNDLRLERDNAFHDFIGNGTSTIDQRSFSATVPPANDTGPPAAMDTDPQPNGNIYDWDAAGLDNTVVAPLNQIRRTRNNFSAFASITVNGTAVRCSRVRLYFIVFSMRQTASPSGRNWVVINPPDVTGDNQAAYGLTRLTWNLQ